MKPIKPYVYLPYLGAVPFFGCTCLLALGIESFAYIGDIARVMTSYGLAIVSFMAGCHWGMHLSPEVRSSQRWVTLLPLISNFVTLIAWFSYLIFSARIIMIVMAICFLVLLIVDGKLKHADLIETQYFRVRCWVSKIVIASLCSASVMVA